VKTLLIILTAAVCLCAQSSTAPNYTAAGIVNGASFTTGLAPNTIVSLFGTNLSWDTRGLRSSDIVGGILPTSLANVEVYLEGWPAYLYYVSPTQINFLIPSVLLAGTFNFWVARQGVAGPMVQITLQPAAPALFQTGDGKAIATHLDGSLVSSAKPAGAGEVVTLWTNGLGATNPDVVPGGLPSMAQWLSHMETFNIWLGGTPIDHSLVLYAGVAPGFAGLYQVNVRLPQSLPPNPELRLAVGSDMSPAGIILPAQ
jgi:uncharacterized protein (TIGR03437 family)